MVVPKALPPVADPPAKVPCWRDGGQVYADNQINPLNPRFHYLEKATIETRENELNPSRDELNDEFHL